MSVTLTYTFASIGELQAHLAGKHDTPAVAKTGTVQEKKPAAAEPSAPAAGAASTASSPAQETQRSDTGEKSYTVDDAKALTMKIVASKGRDAAVALLQKYGVPVAAKLPTEKVAGFCAEAEGVLA